MSRGRFIALSVIVDALVVNAGFIIAFLIRFGGRLPLYNFEAYLLLAPFLTVFFVAGAWVYGLYDPERSDTAWAVARGAVAAVTIGALLTAAVAFFGSARTAPFARSTILVAWALDLVLLTGWRTAFFRMGRIRWPEQRVLIVGTDRGSVELAEKVSQRARWGWKMIGFVETPNGPGQNAPVSVGGQSILGNVGDIARIVNESRANRVIIASPIALREFVESLVLANELKVRIDVVPELYEIFIGTVDAIVGDVPVMQISRATVPRYYSLIKRTADIVVSVAALLFGTPVLLVSALAIVLQDGFPIFFSQERVGRYLKPFRIHKLRTMIKDAERATGPVLAEEGDARITRVGHILRKFRVDEFPQLIDILRGQMSFVGPRPERPYFVEQYLEEVNGYRERFNVKPGLTGLAQVSGSYATTPERKLKYDLIYIYHQTPAMDMQIVAETLRVVLTGRGAR
jgi:exopolysaccharide biosynthesis polyprenyl glycosylphosphotransferase